MARMRGLLAGWMAAAVLGTAPAAGAPCAPETRQSPCFDADALLVPAAPSRFAGISSTTPLESGSLSLGADATYLTRPVVLSTLAPDPDGREVPAVRRVVDVSIAVAYAPVHRLELSLVIPFAAHRSGTGLRGVTSQNGPDLGAAFRDVRLGAGYGAVDARIAGGARFTVMPRLDVLLPTGDETTFAGERSVLLWPRVGAGVALGRFFADSELGARLREPVELGGARLGTELTASLGAGVSALDRGLLDVALETWLRFSPISQRRPDGSGVLDGTLVPAEWMLSVRSQVGSLSFRMGAGTALPLSSEVREDAEGRRTSASVAGLTAPEFRALAGVRYTPRF